MFDRVRSPSFVCDCLNPGGDRRWFFPDLDDGLLVREVIGRLPAGQARARRQERAREQVVDRLVRRLARRIFTSLRCTRFAGVEQVAHGDVQLAVETVVAAVG